MTSLPDPSNDYQATLVMNLSRAVWNAVFGSIGARLRALEGTTADYEAAIAQLETQALAVISATITDEITARRADFDELEADIALAQDEIALLRAGGVDADVVTLTSIAGLAAVNAQAAIAELLTKIEAEATARASAIAVALGGIDTTPSIARSARTSNTMLGADDASKLIDITSGTFAQTLDAAATLGDGWFCYILNSGTGVVTLTPSSPELISGLGTLAVHTGQAYLVQCDGAGFNVVLISGEALFIAESERPSNTFEGSASSGFWFTRTLNTVRTNTINGASLASNQITLPKGTYEVDASAPAMAVNGHRIRLFNVTLNAAIALGDNTTASSAAFVSTRSCLSSVFSLSESCSIRLEHRVSDTYSGNGALGPISQMDTPEIFSRIKIRKIR